MNHAFLSLVLVDPSNQSDLEPILHLLMDKLQQISSQFEIIVVENTLSDERITSLLEISNSEAMKNLTVLCLSDRTNFQTAAWAGLENSLGDFVCIFNPINDDIDQIENLFQQSAEGFDIVYGTGILHHLEINKCLNEIHRILKPDGNLLFVEPLGTNPLINLYRKFTPNSRSKDEHPFTKKPKFITNIPSVLA